MTTRRLAAILAADVVGSSRLIEADEDYALTAIREVLHDVLVGTAASHGGRLIKTMGDGALLEFASPVAAVTCATAVQGTLAARAASEPEDRRVLLRIGVNLGDVVAQTDGDLYGDGVNIAARLESIASPGGIAISGKVHDELQGKVNLLFEDQGEQSLKNVARPVRVYALGGSALGAKGIGKPLPLPDKPSIAVLPFTNMSGDHEQEYFADGVVEDIITALSRFKSLFVIARNSSFTYKGRAVDVKQVGKELGVRYVLAGSIRKSGDRVRISGQLIDVRTGAHLWADRFDGAVANVFELQDDVTDKVVGAINPAVEQAEIDNARRTEKNNPDAYDQYLRGMAQINLFTREGNQASLPFFVRATELDAEFATAHAMAGWSFVQRKSHGWSKDYATEAEHARQYAEKAVDLARDDAVVLARAGHTLAYVVRDLDRGKLFIDRAVSLNSNLAAAWYASGWLRIWLGDSELALEHLARVVRLSPRDAMMPGIQGATAFALFFAGRVDEAAACAEEILRERPRFHQALRAAAMSHSLAGRFDEARRAMTRLREVDGRLRISNLRELSPLRREQDIARYEEGLRLAGLPE
jgi:adenylate cyclase